MKPKLIIGNKNYSSWSLRSWLLLKEAGIAFDEHRIVLDTETSAAEIAAFSAAGRVPILQLGDLTVWDTLAIAETVAERWPEKQLWPADADERAKAAGVELAEAFALLDEVQCWAHKSSIHDFDRDRMGAMGWSQGGYISAFLTTSSHRFAAISVGAVEAGSNH